MKEADDKVFNAWGDMLELIGEGILREKADNVCKYFTDDDEEAMHCEACPFRQTDGCWLGGSKGNIREAYQRGFWHGSTMIPSGAFVELVEEESLCTV
jgi:hypothetical protein